MQACGWFAATNVSQHMFIPIGSLHAVVHSDVSLQMSCRDDSATTRSYSCQVWCMTHAGLWHIAGYLFLYQCDDWRTVKPWTSRCWRRLADNIGRLWISRYIECFSIHVVAHCKPACRFCIPTSHFRCLVQMRLQTLSDVLTVSRWVFLQIGGTWRTQACRISKCIFYFTNVDTEELSNHELHDVEGDLLTISGGCGWCSI